MTASQAGILSPISAHGRYLHFDVKAEVDPTAIRASLAALQPLADGQDLVLGLGQSLALALGKNVPGLREFIGVAGSRVKLPATPAALWCWLRANERGQLVHATRSIVKALAPAFELQHQAEAFCYRNDRDLTGYEDGTENPQGAEAVQAALVQGQGVDLDGSSFVAIQQWRHQFDQFDAMSGDQQDNAIGRRQSDNEELEDAPATAHVKRTAQEDFDPPAFMLRRSMPWSEGLESGLYFAAFGNSFYAFEAQLRRMSGAEDGQVDALFRFSQPQSGAYFWCPPMRDGKVDMSWVL